MIDNGLLVAGGGIIGGLLTIFLKKLKCYWHRDSNGGYDMTMGFYMTTPAPLEDDKERK